MVKFTTEAASRFKQVVQENPSDFNEGTAFRVFVQGAGCAGYEFGFGFATEFDEGDVFFESEGAKIVVDPISYQYVQGATIEYKKELMGEYFTLNNPNAKTTCGCGNSFSL